MINPIGQWWSAIQIKVGIGCKQCGQAPQARGLRRRRGWSLGGGLKPKVKVKVGHNKAKDNNKDIQSVSQSNGLKSKVKN